MNVIRAIIGASITFCVVLINTEIKGLSVDQELFLAMGISIAVFLILLPRWSKSQQNEPLAPSQTTLAITSKEPKGGTWKPYIVTAAAYIVGFSIGLILCLKWMGLL